MATIWPAAWSAGAIRTANLLLQTTTPGLGTTDTFTYDPASRLLTAASGQYGTLVTRSYTDNDQQAGLLTSELQTVEGVSFAVHYAYDAANRPVTLVYPDGSVITRTYTVRNQLASVSRNGSPIASSLTYDAGMRRTGLVYGNGLQERRTYRADNLVQTITTPGVTEFTYTYDANKNVTQEINGLTPAENQAFGFDTENRVTAVAPGRSGSPAMGAEPGRRLGLHDAHGSAGLQPDPAA